MKKTLGLALAALLAFTPAAVANTDWNEAQWNGPVNQAAVSVTGSATKLITTAEINDRPRKGVIITPTDGKIYYGGPSVTAANGQPLESGQTLFLSTSRGQNWYAIRDAGSVNTRVTIVY